MRFFPFFSVSTFLTASLNDRRTKRADFLLLSLPALWYNPFFWQRAWNGNSIAVAGLTDLTNQFNSELRAISTNLTQSVATRGGKVFYGDLSSLWVDMSEKPRNYGFTIPWIFDPWSVCLSFS